MPHDDITIAKRFIKATKDVLSTMSGLEAKPGRPFAKKDRPQEGDVSAVIGLTGMRRGTISVSFQRAAALALLKGMLGDDIQNEQQDMEDVVGEVCNMISGQARAALDSDGLNLQGSTPTVVTGAGHSIHHAASGPVIAIPFELASSAFTVEFCFDANNG